ncbi:MAG: pentapeptide repeat-containing protein [Peptococcaceae bacterium]|jgi:uncharacterized protein YjbI with pentapeptide repeats|nr:pentapeptide repeat-containing protein [Peptococcaceae bacterium]
MPSGNSRASHFEIEQKSRECLARLEEYLSLHTDALTDKFLRQFEQYCHKIASRQETGEKQPLSFIHLSVLRTNILARRHTIRLDAYDENWYADRAELSGEYDAAEFYTGLDAFADALHTAAKPYGDLKPRQVQKAVFEESKKYLVVIAEFVRIALRKAAETEWFQRLNRNPLFAVCIGEFQDRCDIVYKEDTTVKDAGTVKRGLEEKLPVYTHEICENLNLSHGQYDDIRLLYSNFSGCDFSGSSLKNAVILYSDFKGTRLRDVDLGKAQIIGADFSGALLENVNFKGALLKNVSFRGAKFSQVNLEEAILAEDLDLEQVVWEGTRVNAWTTS